LIFGATIVLSELEGKEISCERFGEQDWNNSGKKVKLCYMTPSTSIDSSGATVSTHDETIKLLFLGNNKKIFYLPDNVGGKFPNLLYYVASNCSIAQINQQNFKALNKLEFLDLRQNQIEKITSNTFDGLKELKNLDLGTKNIIF
jgi:Leucine rich repeat